MRKVKLTLEDINRIANKIIEQEVADEMSVQDEEVKSKTELRNWALELSKNVNQMSLQPADIPVFVQIANHLLDGMQRGSYKTELVRLQRLLK